MIMIRHQIAKSLAFIFSIQLLTSTCQKKSHDDDQAPAPSNSSGHSDSTSDKKSEDHSPAAPSPATENSPTQPTNNPIPVTPQPPIQDPSTPEPTSTDFAIIRNQIFKPSCNQCHGGQFPAGELDLESDNGVAASIKSQIIPGNHAVSPLSQSITSGAMPPDDSFPVVSPKLLQLLDCWIDAGATTTGNNCQN
jgi:hypothetical protein